jgi:hypothetical protein
LSTTGFLGYKLIKIEYTIVWYKFATDEYDLKELNKEVKIDDAAKDIMNALHSGQSLDLSDRGFKGIKVVQHIPEMEDEEEQIDVHNPRKEGQFNQYNGISLDHFQGIAFACQSLKKEIQKVLPTFKYIQSTYYPDFKFDFEKKINENIISLDHLNDNAINQMVRADDMTNAWHDKKDNNIPIWSKKHFDNSNYNQFLDKTIEHENNWCDENLTSFWKIWHLIRTEMFDFLHYIPDPLYKKLWLELIPI